MGAGAPTCSVKLQPISSLNNSSINQYSKQSKYPLPLSRKHNHYSMQHRSMYMTIFHEERSSGSRYFVALTVKVVSKITAITVLRTRSSETGWEKRDKKE